MCTKAIEEPRIQAAQQSSINENELCRQVFASIEETCQQIIVQTEAHLKAFKEP